MCQPTQCTQCCSRLLRAAAASPLALPNLSSTLPPRPGPLQYLAMLLCVIFILLEMRYTGNVLLG